MKEHEHEYFRELCALAPVGELSDEEARKLDEHLAECEECRNLAEEFERVSFGALPLRGEDGDFQDSTASDRQIQRFQARLGEELAGDPRKSRYPGDTQSVSRLQERPEMSSPRGRRRSSRWLLAAAIPLLAATGTLWHVWRGAVEANQTLSRHNASLLLQLETAQRSLSELQASHASETSPESAPEENLPTTGQRVDPDQFQQVKARLAETNERMTRLIEEKAKLTADLTDLRRTIDQKDVLIRKQRASIESSEARSHAIDERVRRQREQIDALKTQLVKLDREKQSLELSLRENVGVLFDPSLTVVSVFNVQNRSARSNAGGRILLRAGHPAVLYAFDLKPHDWPDPPSKSRFQLWGLKEVHPDLDAMTFNLLAKSPATHYLGQLAEEPSHGTWSVSFDPDLLNGLTYLLIVRPGEDSAELGDKVVLYGRLEGR